MTTTIQDLAQKLESAQFKGKLKEESNLPGVFVFRSTSPTEFEAMVYDPIVCLIVQGEKLTTIGEETVTLSAGSSIVVGHDLPVLARIRKASIKSPYLSLVIRLDLELLRSLDSVLDDFDIASTPPRSLEVTPASAPLLDVLGRYLALFDDPVEAKVLLPLLTKELHFRLLVSEAGGMLRALLNRDSHASSIARAIRRLREEFRSPLEVAELAKSVGMSTSSFHRHFKSMTRTSPLQFHKDLRLTEARRLLQSGECSVSSAAFEVGYESPSQFSREYSRKFGAPPRADLRVA